MTVLLAGLIGQAQDSLAVFQSSSIHHLDSVTSVQILASLEDSSVMVGKERMGIFLYMKNKDCWARWSIEEACEADFLAMRLRIRLEQKKINAKGQAEILIWWESESGIASSTHGWSEEQKGIQVWDIDTHTRLLDLVYEERSENWSLQTETSLEEMMLTDSSSQEKRYELYDEWFFCSLNIDEDSLVISSLQAKGSTSQNAELAIPASPIQEGTFKLIAGRFVRVVKE